MNKEISYQLFGIRIPEKPNEVCDEIYEKLRVKCMIVDANDFSIEILGKASCIECSKEMLADMIRDNPAGQSKQLTPLILIRKEKI